MSTKKPEQKTAQQLEAEEAAKLIPVKVEAKKYWHLFCPPKVDIHIKKGTSYNVPKFLIASLVTEKVIDKPKA